jgi:ligand-binding SRPBCC domain-containing protein
MRDFLTAPLRVSTIIHAPLDRVWALSIDVGIVQQTLKLQLAADKHHPSIMAGPVSMNARVYWRGWKFGMPVAHHTLITAFEPPHEVRADGELDTPKARSHEAFTHEARSHEAFTHEAPCREAFTHEAHSHEAFTHEAPCREAFFEDTQERGRFAVFHHGHHFKETMASLIPHAGPQTELTDLIYFRMPFGVAGKIIASTILAPDIHKLATQRFALLKRLAEASN